MAVFTLSRPIISTIFLFLFMYLPAVLLTQSGIVAENSNSCGFAACPEYKIRKQVNNGNSLQPGYVRRYVDSGYNATGASLT